MYICAFAEQADCFGQVAHTCVPTAQEWFLVATSLSEYRKQLEAPTGAHLGTSHDGSLKASVLNTKPEATLVAAD